MLLFDEVLRRDETHVNIKTIEIDAIPSKFWQETIIYVQVAVAEETTS